MKNIKIKNLRAIKELQLDNFGQVNLFVGENNCGKTTVLEALFLLCGAKNPQLLIKINSLRRLPFISDEILCTFFHNMEYERPIEII
ncbi:MAG: AAA family ATPase, partial [Planctomycetes bacterium]|nr:AAA family ATPase [Planctomycetota bacterium]